MGRHTWYFVDILSNLAARTATTACLFLLHRRYRHHLSQVASARIFMVVLWAVWMLCRIYISGCLLKKLPYVPNRYQQLSYRFFALQVFARSYCYCCILVALVAVLMWMLWYMCCAALCPSLRVTDLCLL